MLVMQKRSCSWLLIVAIGSVVVLVSLVQLSLLPWRPTLEYFSIKQVQTTCIPLKRSTKGTDINQQDVEASRPGFDFTRRFPADVHKAVVYRSAPWKAEIGQWLSGCDSVVKEINITEVLISQCVIFNLESYIFRLNYRIVLDVMYISHHNCIKFPFLSIHVRKVDIWCEPTVR